MNIDPKNLEEYVASLPQEGIADYAKEHIVVMKQVVVELELMRVSLDGVARAIREYVQETLHTVR